MGELVSTQGAGPRSVWGIDMVRYDSVNVQRLTHGAVHGCRYVFYTCAKDGRFGDVLFACVRELWVAVFHVCPCGTVALGSTSRTGHRARSVLVASQSTGSTGRSFPSTSLVHRSTS